MKVNMSDCMRSVVVTVKLVGIGRLKLRIRLAMMLFRVGVWIMGANFKGEVITDESD